MLEGKPPLGTMTIPGYGGQYGDDDYLDFACVFARDAASKTGTSAP